MRLKTLAGVAISAFVAGLIVPTLFHRTAAASGGVPKFELAAEARVT
ncbi:MAG TPA: hypothetical protein VGL82_21125 [Bryobacteraceae bacterium]|jgi:hypothetical protein